MAKKKGKPMDATEAPARPTGPITPTQMKLGPAVLAQLDALKDRLGLKSRTAAAVFAINALHRKEFGDESGGRKKS